MWWNGNRLEADVIALVVFARTSSTEPPVAHPTLGAASSTTGSVLLLPNQLESFMCLHRDVTLVCHDAARLHWLLESEFQRSNNQQALEVLWAFSLEGRLVDVMLLDQHVRRTATSEVAPRSLAEIVCESAGQTVLPDDELRGIVAQAWASRDLNDEVCSDLLAVVAGCHAAFLDLQRRAEEIANACISSSNLPLSLVRPPDNPEEIQAACSAMINEALMHQREMGFVTARETQRGTPPATVARSRLTSFGPLGSGIDVQAAIALRNPRGPVLRIDPGQLEILRHRNGERLQQAAERLYADTVARGCFRWQSPEVPSVKDGRIRLYSSRLQEWLAGLHAKLVDLHGQPAAIPTARDGKPSFDPERWGILAACHRSLAAWRDLSRAVRLEYDLNLNGESRPDYEIVPVLRARAPNLIAYRSMGVPVFRPADGHIFLCGKLPLLKLHCFAAAQQRHSSVPSRLAEYFLRQTNPLERLAGELYEQSPRELWQVVEAQAEKASAAPRQPETEDSRDFAALAESHPLRYRHWCRMTQALLEAFSLGLPESLMSPWLQHEYGLDANGGVNLLRLMQVVERQIVCELEDFHDDRVCYRLASVLGMPLMECVRALTQGDHVETTAAALRNDLLERRRDRRVWDLIDDARRRNAPAAAMTDNKLVETVLRPRATTLAGRAIGPAVHCELRRQEMRLTADEVMKSVAYALTAAGFPLVTVSDDEFVVEVPEEKATGTFIQSVADLASTAGRRVLGRFAPQCACESAYLC